LANFDFDQAEGLRRMLAGPKPRIVTFLSAMPNDKEKGAMLVNLGASLVRAGSDVLLVDASLESSGVASRAGASYSYTLMDVARQECPLDRVVQQMSQGFGIVTLGQRKFNFSTISSDEARRLAHAFDLLAKQTSIVVVDGEFGISDDFPVPAMANSEIVVQVSTSPASIKAAYCLIKRLNAQLGRRPFSLLVTGATEDEAKVVYENMAQAASRYLAIQLTSMGSVPADEHLHRAARLGRAVVDAYPLAGASVAFRRLAGKFTLSAVPTVGLRGKVANGTNLGT
jgi:flagellar biosynthesis protein FlhG